MFWRANPKPTMQHRGQAHRSYNSPTQKAGSAQMELVGPPSAPRISMYRFSRTSGKMVVRCVSQSFSDGLSPAPRPAQAF